MKYLTRPMIGWVVLVAAVLAIPYVITSQYTLRVLGMTALQAGMAVTFAMILRFGYVSLAHVAFGAIGAYLSAALMVRAGWSFWPALLVALVVVSAIALGMGWLILRLKGPYFFLISFCFLEAVILFFRNVGKEIFGGPNGIVGVPRPSSIPLGFLEIKFLSMHSFYVTSAITLLLSIWIVWRVMQSRYGTVLLAARQSSILTATVGIDVFRHKVMAFVLCSTLAGLLGATLGTFNGVVHISDFSLHAQVMLVVFAVVGGSERVWGPVLGTVLLALIGEQLRSLQEIELLAYGLLLVMVMVAWPTGLAGALLHLYDKLRLLVTSRQETPVVNR